MFKRNPKVLIYADSGADPFYVSALHQQFSKVVKDQGGDIRLVGAEDIIARNCLKEENVASIVFPGGKDIYYHDKLRGTGNEKIRDFVEQGGNYFGICAGAYYACEQIAYQKGKRGEVCADRELGFFKGKAVGPQADLRGAYASDACAGAATVRLKYPDNPDAIAVSYFHNGPSFVPGQGSSAKILAQYDTWEQSSIAAVSMDVGKGNIVLCGPHPEVTGDQILTEARTYTPVHEPPKDLALLLQRHEQKRADFWQLLMKEAHILAPEKEQRKIFVMLRRTKKRQKMR